MLQPTTTRRIRTNVLCSCAVLLGLLAVSGCGGSSDSSRRSNSNLAFERNDHLHIVPSEPYSFHRLQAGGVDFIQTIGIANAQDDIRFERLSWRVNGEEVHRGMYLESQHFHRDDIVELVQLDEDGETEVARAMVTILNSPPRVTGATLAHARNQGNMLECHIASLDPDNEPLSFEFEWKLDGVRFAGARGPRVSLRDLKKGQRIGVTVRAFDGSAYSQPLAPREFIIDNLPPTIGEIGQATIRSMEDGTRVLQMRFNIEDPDGDSLDVAFHGVPSGYNWDLDSGVLQWVFRGLAEARTIQVRVSDGRGAVVQHQLEIAGEVAQGR